jgi:hypothetical protein
MISDYFYRPRLFEMYVVHIMIMGYDLTFPSHKKYLHHALMVYLRSGALQWQTLFRLTQPTVTGHPVCSQSTTEHKKYIPKPDKTRNALRPTILCVPHLA